MIHVAKPSLKVTIEMNQVNHTPIDSRTDTLRRRKGRGRREDSVRGRERAGDGRNTQQRHALRLSIPPTCHLPRSPRPSLLCLAHPPAEASSCSSCSAGTYSNATGAQRGSRWAISLRISCHGIASTLQKDMNMVYHKDQTIFNDYFDLLA